MWALVAVALAAVLAGGASTALGHSEVVATTPRDGARVEAAPRAVLVAYTSPLAAAREAAVRGPDGSARAATPRIDARDARRVSVPVRDVGPGRYRASWTVLGADGHELAGSTSFVVRAPPIAAELRELAALMRRAARALEVAREAATER